MNVIFDAADDESRALPLFENARLIGEQSSPMLFWNQWLAMFCAVHEMHQVLDEGLGHGICV
jgi:hypothetical protein